MGWTGKINQIPKPKTATQTPAEKLKTPVAGMPNGRPQAGTGPGLLRRQTTFGLGSIRLVEEPLRITRQDREVAEEKLLSRAHEQPGYGKVAPVWLGDSEVDDPDAVLTVGEDWERWGMLSQKGKHWGALEHLVGH